MNLIITDDDIREAEEVLLSKGNYFSPEGINIIKNLSSIDIIACPGSGKTTLLLAKLYILAKYMPFPNNTGVCVLSHTNVAINEIKNKFGNRASILNQYPNHIGTIQSFIDKFLLFPYIVRYTSKRITLCDDNEYYTLFKKIYESYDKYIPLKNAIKMKYNQIVKYSKIDEVKFLSNFSLDNSGVYYGEKSKSLFASNQTCIYNLFKNIKDFMFKENGMITYNESYYYAKEVLKLYKNELRNLLSKRFKYVFIDEYQDCVKEQRIIIDSLFDSKYVCIQKIGDPDQSIYDSMDSNPQPWKHSNNFLTLKHTKRFHKLIADEISKLRMSKESIISDGDKKELIKPKLILFDDTTITDVIRTFIDIVKEYKIQEKDKHPIKVIGKVNKSPILKIDDYLSNYQVDNSINNIFNTYINSISKSIEERNTNDIYRLIMDLLLKGLRRLDIRDDNKKYFTKNTIKVYLDKQEFRIEDFIISLIKNKYDIDSIKTLIINYFKDIAKDKYDNDIIDELINETVRTQKTVDYIMIDNIKLHISTVHKAKGETHAATLYLETVFKNNSDLQNIMQILNNSSYKSSGIIEECRKVVYVGFSRPSLLLCVAIRKSTYKGNESVFRNWDIIDLCKE